MGQRIQIYMVEYNAANTDTEHPHMNHPEQYRITAYHNQWGYGWRGVLDVIGLILLTRLQEMASNPFLLSGKISHLSSTDTERLYQKLSPEEIKDLCKPFAESVNKWKDMVDFGDNNNGIIVIRKTIRDYGGIDSLETMFLRGGEDSLEPDDEDYNNNDYADVLTAREYCEQFGEDAESVVNMFENLIAGFNGTEFKEPTKEKQ